MKYCSKCGKEILDEAIVCPNCGCAVVNATIPQQIENDQVSIGFCVLSALIPLFGFIYWAVKHKEVPKKARACGITAIISWAISFVVSFVFSFMITMISMY
ncbi:MAG: zinc ribbon domain-containing protein [Clostridia bacterium]|nr:zinc ribbon domain-containing protein [Clostridia bacterium]